MKIVGLHIIVICVMSISMYILYCPCIIFVLYRLKYSALFLKWHFKLNC